MNITEYRKKLDDIIEDLEPEPDLSEEINNDIFIARMHGRLLREIALCIAGNTSELIGIRSQLEALRTQLPEPNKPIKNQGGSE